MTADAATEQLVRVHEYTDDRGYATAEVVAEPYVSEDRLSVPVEVLTTGTRHTLRFDLPTTWSEEYDLVRLVESVGYGPGGIDLLVGERFPVEIAGDPDDGVALDPVFDPEEADDSDRTVAGVTVPELSRETAGRGALGAVRLAGRSAQYAAALATFSVVISVGALVAATVTYAAVLGGLLVTALMGAIGALGVLLPVLFVVSALRVGLSRRLRSRPGHAGGSSRSAPEIHRYR